ncbi:hypothetical protein HPB51_003013 [Rhipicephalus microplus]|uniref:Uncharacterized protein n=1 Tax=Rhipicephalus microplus TaxID=6941 RepID=A0A9J6DSX0_RHIMP|nr:hypothetical protein HPB51_003013 [Rhipicephalus microplus]
MLLAGRTLPASGMQRRQMLGGSGSVEAKEARVEAVSECLLTEVIFVRGGIRGPDLEGYGLGGVPKLLRGLSGGTTVSATMVACNRAGIQLFATGGIGGVHRGGEFSLDISPDVMELGRSPVTVVSSGIKSILDIGRTLEVLPNNVFWWWVFFGLATILLCSVLFKMAESADRKFRREINRRVNASFQLIDSEADVINDTRYVDRDSRNAERESDLPSEACAVDLEDGHRRLCVHDRERPSAHSSIVPETDVPQGHVLISGDACYPSGCSVSVPHDHTDFERRAFHDSSAAASTSATSQIQQLAGLGGSTFGAAARRMLELLLSLEVAVQFSWAGQKGKRKFVDLGVTDVICKAVRRNFPETKKNDIECVIKVWLRHAGEKLQKQRLRTSRTHHEECLQSVALSSPSDEDL